MYHQNDNVPLPIRPPLPLWDTQSPAHRLFAARSARSFGNSRITQNYHVDQDEGRRESSEEGESDDTVGNSEELDDFEGAMSASSENNSGRLNNNNTIHSRLPLSPAWDAQLPPPKTPVPVPPANNRMLIHHPYGPPSTLSINPTLPQQQPQPHTESFLSHGPSATAPMTSHRPKANSDMLSRENWGKEIAPSPQPSWNPEYANRTSNRYDPRQSEWSQNEGRHRPSNGSPPLTTNPMMCVHRNSPPQPAHSNAYIENTNTESNYTTDIPTYPPTHEIANIPYLPQRVPNANTLAKAQRQIRPVPNPSAPSWPTPPQLQPVTNNSICSNSSSSSSLSSLTSPTISPTSSPQCPPSPSPSTPPPSGIPNSPVANPNSIQFHPISPRNSSLSLSQKKPEGSRHAIATIPSYQKTNTKPVTYHGEEINIGANELESTWKAVEVPSAVNSGQLDTLEIGPDGPIFDSELLTKLGDEILRFTDWVALRQEEKEARDKLIQLFNWMVGILWKEAEVKVFGSFECGLSLPSSDVDFVILGLGVTWETSPQYLAILSNHLQNHGFPTCVIPSAKVPLLKFYDHRTGLQGDVCFEIPTATRSVDLVRSYIDRYPVAKPLIFVIKTLLRQNDLNTTMTGGLSSYALTLLAVSYLRIREEKAKATHSDVPSLSCDGLSVGALLVQFLWFYATHDLRCAFSPGGETPTCETNRSQPRLEVRDPLDEGNDVTRSCTLFSWLRHNLFVNSLKALTQYDVARCGPSILSTIIQADRLDFLNRSPANTTPTPQPPLTSSPQQSLASRFGKFGPTATLTITKSRTPNGAKMFGPGAWSGITPREPKLVPTPVSDENLHEVHEVPTMFVNSGATHTPPSPIRTPSPLNHYLLPDTYTTTNTNTSASDEGLEAQHSSSPTDATPYINPTDDTGNSDDNIPSSEAVNNSTQTPPLIEEVREDRESEVEEQVNELS